MSYGRGLREYRRLREYILVKFGIPEYNFQSPAYVLPAREVYDRGWEWAYGQARDWFLRDFLRHKGQGNRISPKQAQLFKDGRVIPEVRLRKLTPEAVSLLKGMQSVSVPRKKRVSKRFREGEESAE
jgi:hypothetical protein